MKHTDRRKFSAQHWEDYELIDCGGYEKLERFGDVYLVRPETQARWERKLSDKEWEDREPIYFQEKETTKGDWIFRSNQKIDDWTIGYANSSIDIKLKLALTSFKHVGVFPEQATNWDFISSSLKRMETDTPRVLNLFAYTGGASLAARAAGADVTHVDSIRQVVTWANENQQLSGLDNIRWVVEDAIKFVKREIKRGKTYNGIILDPPAYGHGPKGEKWKLDSHIEEMISDVRQLLDPDEHFFILNVYSLGFTSEVIQNLIEKHYASPPNLEVGDMVAYATSGVELPLGVVARFRQVM